MTTLITGICGMVGGHLSDLLLDREPERQIVGSYYKPTTDISELSGNIRLIECDVRYYHSVLNIIDTYRPQTIYHLAAQSYPPVSWRRPQETFDVNVTGTINVFESVKSVQAVDKTYSPAIVVACSSAEYGQSMLDSNGFVTEESPLLPLSPYGVSKVTQDLLAYEYNRSDGLNTIRARIFNTTGPKKVGDVLADFTRRAVLYKRGKIDRFPVGNVDTIRAITDVRDLAIALQLLAKCGAPGECYNICGSTKYRIGDLLDMLSSIIGKAIVTEVDSELLRPTDEKIIFGDSSKLVSLTGWKQTYPIEVTMRDMVAYWERKLPN